MIQINKQIEILEDIHIPNTDIILEKGDKIIILNTEKAPALPYGQLEALQSIADREKQNGAFVAIAYNIPSINITRSDGESFYLERHEAQDLLAQVPENMSEEDFILAKAYRWG